MILIIGLFFCVAHSLSHSQKPLDILFVVGHFPAPSQIFILNIITGLIDRGHNVRIFSLTKDKLAYVHSDVDRYKLLQRTTYEKFPTHMRNCDIVFCQFGYLGKKLYKMKDVAKWLQGKKVVICFRGSDITSYAKKDPRMYKQLFAQAHLCLPVCDYFKKLLVKHGCDAKKIIVHHSSIDCSKFFFTPDRIPQDNTRIDIITVCRLVKKKGIDYAIKAIAEVVKKYPHVHFSIVGEGPERLYLELLIKQLKLEKKVTLCGWKSQDEVVSLLNKSHVFLLPSITASDGNEEGIPNALKEAMAMGLISVATWHAGTPELIQDGITGFLVPQKDVPKLARKLEYIIEHPDQWRSIALAAREKIESDFETKKSIMELEKIFYRLLG